MHEDENPTIRELLDDIANALREANITLDSKVAILRIDGEYRPPAVTIHRLNDGVWGLEL